MNSKVRIDQLAHRSARAHQTVIQCVTTKKSIVAFTLLAWIASACSSRDLDLGRGEGGAGAGTAGTSADAGKGPKPEPGYGGAAGATFGGMGGSSGAAGESNGGSDAGHGGTGDAGARNEAGAGARSEGGAGGGNEGGGNHGGAAADCLESGGSIHEADCCPGTEDFPNTCLVGACTCSPENSTKQALLCACPDGGCFDGKRCIGRKEAQCTASGGTVTTQLCCEGVTEFPNSCTVGACGCSPQDSHEVSSCACPEGKCFDGTACAPE